MWKITPSGRLFLRVRFSKGSLNNYEGGLNNMVVHVISARSGIFTGSKRTGHGSLRRTESTASDDDAARSSSWLVPAELGSAASEHLW